jgi:hypothetical protein
MIPLIGITISTKYDDLLNIIIKQNTQFLTKWYIVTAENDEKTIDLIKNSNCTNIEILYFDFWKNKEKFNKGGAVQYAQKVVYDTYTHQGVDIYTLILDSDIYLPDNFGSLYEKVQENNSEKVLYAPQHRIDFAKYSDFHNRKNGKLYHLDQKHMGFFQLYFIKKSSETIFDLSSLYYKNSVNCAACDSAFRNFFPQRKIIHNLFVSHLGTPRVNWNTRKSHDDFIMDI